MTGETLLQRIADAHHKNPLLTRKELAEVCQCPVTYVNRAIGLRDDIKPPYHVHKFFYEVLYRRYISGQSVAAIANHLSISIGAVNRIIYVRAKGWPLTTMPFNQRRLIDSLREEGMRIALWKLNGTCYLKDDNSIRAVDQNGNCSIPGIETIEPETFKRSENQNGKPNQESK